MKIVILFDSYFGNTEKVAESIKEGLETSGELIMHRFIDVSPDILENTDILILGSPTRAFRPTKAAIDFLKSLPSNGLKGIKTAAFDTRMDLRDVESKVLKKMAGLFGYAAEPLNKLMVKKGGISVAEPEGFYVKGNEGPMHNGELERASSWASSILE
ncbi:MAG: flavodoxin family protein [Spirochaetales bacterium]|nr:flavodoxin family protein [Spirochaetales bacterium]